MRNIKQEISKACLEHARDHFSEALRRGVERAVLLKAWHRIRLNADARVYFGVYSPVRNNVKIVPANQIEWVTTKFIETMNEASDMGI